MSLKNNILRVLKRQRKFQDNPELINKINSVFVKLSEKSLTKSTVPGYSFDAEYTDNNHKYAICIVQKFNKEAAKHEVGYKLQQMEQAEERGLIEGGLAIYITDNHSEWVGANKCLTITNGDNYNGKALKLKKQYCNDWVSPLQNRETRRRYALLFTKGGETLDSCDII